MLTDFIQKLVAIPSPSGYTQNLIDYLETLLATVPCRLTRSNKGALLAATCSDPEIILAAHIDTLGAMVNGINSDGTLNVELVGGVTIPSFEGEYVTIITQSDNTYRGTFLLKNPAAHVNPDVQTTERKITNMHIRLDAVTNSAQGTADLGIRIGDYVCFDPRFELTDTGFIKSRFLDDKACAAVFCDLLLNHFDSFKNKKVGFFFSNYEEVGHGVPAGIPASVGEMLVADMGVVGTGVTGRETAVSICAMDTSGPYDYALRIRLEKLARQAGIPFEVDIFPLYSSDGSVALKAGRDVRVGLIGPGVSGSHGAERTHIDGVTATKNLILEYLKTS
ncbi:M42 family metallopeptidase [bacterium]|nr:M42 family metallopeptidase [bacterium]